LQQRLGVVAAPGLGREAAQDDPDVRDAATVAVEAQGDGGGGEGEGVGGAVADLHVHRRLPRAARHGDTGEEVAGGQRRLDVGAVAGRPVQVLDGEGAGRPVGAGGGDQRVEGDERDGEVARVVGDAVVAGAEDGEAAGVAAAGGAAGAGPALVARGAAVAEVGAAGALQEVAADRGDVADLGARGEGEGLDDGGERAGDVGVRGAIVQRAPTVTPVGSTATASRPSPRVWRSTRTSGRGPRAS
jgi:hypothetical protein